MPAWIILLKRAVTRVRLCEDYEATIHYGDEGCSVSICMSDTTTQVFYCQFDYTNTTFDEAVLMARAFMTFACIPKNEINELLNYE